MIAKSMQQFLTEHPHLKYVFFGGKGGVGKTVMAGAAAMWFAQQGVKTLLASTNPVHSLTGLLDQNVFGKPTLVRGVSNFFAYEIDTKDTIEKSKREIKEKIEWFLKFADIKTKADEFVESATMNPAFEESAMFENMIDLMFQDKYQVYVFDTAPTANARRLLGMSSVYSMVGQQNDAKPGGGQIVARIALLQREKEKKDPLMDYLINFRERMANAKTLLTDPAKTAFFFITLPGGLADCRHQTLHQLVPRLRDSGWRCHRQHAHRQGRFKQRLAGICRQPSGHAKGLHGPNLEILP